MPPLWVRFLNPFWVGPMMKVARQGDLTVAKAAAHFQLPPTEETMAGFPEKLEAFVRRRTAAAAGKPKATHGAALLWFLMSQCNFDRNIALWTLALLFLFFRIASQLSFSVLMAVFADDTTAFFVKGRGMPPTALVVAAFCVANAMSAWCGYQMEL